MGSPSLTSRPAGAENYDAVKSVVRERERERGSWRRA